MADATRSRKRQGFEWKGVCLHSRTDGGSTSQAVTGHICWSAVKCRGGQKMRAVISPWPLRARTGQKRAGPGRL
jgi:hypothetical protein